MTCAAAPERDHVTVVRGCGSTDLLSLDADGDGLGPILLAAAETGDVGNLGGGRREEELRPPPSLVTTEHPRVCEHI